MRIAIVHAQSSASEALCALVAADPALALAWTAGTGRAAVAQCHSDRPDLLLLDLALPDIDAADATRSIMIASPCAILVTSGEDQARAPYRALAAGALDSVLLPARADTEASLVPLRRKLVQLQRILGHAASGPSAPGRAAVSPSFVPTLPRAPSLLAIGASTGGPAVIADLLRACPAPLAMPCVLVQHLDAEFAAGMATWLGVHTGHRVVLAAAGTRPQAGTVHLGRGPAHLVLDRHGCFAERREPADYPYRPSIDEFFLSAAGLAAPGCAVLLTGMGRDGARGLAALRRRGWSTIVQDPAGCAAPGMPQAAFDAGAAQFVLNPSQIAAALAALTPRGLCHDH